MTLKEALLKYEKVRRKCWEGGKYITTVDAGYLVNQDGVYIFFNVSLLEDDWEEYKPDVLDEEEKEYLSVVIGPFRSRVICIRKLEYGPLKYSINIRLYREKGDDAPGNDYIRLPFFTGDKMYKGMEADKSYTLEELGL